MPAPDLHPAALAAAAELRVLAVMAGSTNLSIKLAKGDIEAHWAKIIERHTRIQELEGALRTIRMGAYCTCRDSCSCAPRIAGAALGEK